MDHPIKSGDDFVCELSQLFLKFLFFYFSCRNIRLASHSFENLTHLMEKPYHILPVEKFGDKFADQTYMSVGRALSSWETLETAMESLFSILLAANIFSSARIYGTCVSFTGRIDMINAASEIFFLNHKHKHARIKKFTKVISEFSNRRNDIAHGYVVRYLGDENFEGHYLLPSAYSTRKHSLGYAVPAYMYNSKQILFYESHFDDLTNRVYRKVDAIHKWATTMSIKDIPPLDENNQGLRRPQSLLLPPQKG
jgi:hypothetical protein